MTELETSAVIGRWRGEQDARRYRSNLSDEHFEALKTAITEVMTVCPPMAGACVLMSALLVESLHSLDVTNAFAIAGDLHVPGGRVFGEDRNLDWSSIFSKSDQSWDGHCWVALGGWVADISVFRTASSGFAPPLLATHLTEATGRRSGALVCTEDAALEMGFSYHPRYALSDQETSVLADSALRLIASG